MSSAEAEWKSTLSGDGVPCLQCDILMSKHQAGVFLISQGGRPVGHVHGYCGVRFIQNNSGGHYAIRPAAREDYPLKRVEASEEVLAL